MKRKERWILTEAAQECGLSPDIMLRFISLEWIHPADPERNEFDQEDISRARFIVELQSEFGVNDAGVPIILQLLDQLHFFRHELKAGYLSAG
jgi:chaperone modulatory protein CbpM